MAKDYMVKLFPEKKCKKCGKKFIPAPQHMYRDGRDGARWYCSWTCYNHRKDTEARVKNDEGTT